MQAAKKKSFSSPFEVTPDIFLFSCKGIKPHYPRASGTWPQAKSPLCIIQINERTLVSKLLKEARQGIGL